MDGIIGFDHDAWIECSYDDLEGVKISRVVSNGCSEFDLYTDCGFIFGIFPYQEKYNQIWKMSEGDQIIKQ